jgi:virginiamycin B lyase
MTTAGAVAIFPLPKAGAAPGAIVKGPDGALWFNEQTAPRLGRITTAGSIEEFSPPVAPNFTGGIAGSMTAGNDGALWFIASGAIGRITPAGTFTKYASPQVSAFNGIVLGPQGAFWLSDLTGAIWRFVP